jgi:hypothetical protein
VLGLLQRIEQAVRGRINIVASIAAELDHEKAAACGQVLASPRIDALDSLVVEEAMIDALECDWLVWQYRGHGVGRGHDVWEAKDDQGSFANDRDQLQLGPKHRNERGLAAD